MCCNSFIVLKKAKMLDAFKKYVIQNVFKEIESALLYWIEQ